MKPYFFKENAAHIQKTDNGLEMKIILDPKKMPFMKDHFFAGTCLIPGAIMAEMMLTACVILTNNDEIFPLTLNSLKIDRGIQVEPDQQNTVTIIAKCLGKSETGIIYEVECRGDKMNQAGKVVRSNILIAKAQFTLHQKIHSLDPSIKAEYSIYKIGQKAFYNFFIRTHRYLFQTLLGNIGITHDKRFIKTEFNIENKENSFSLMKNLPFILSPLGFDSILQTAVTYSVIVAPGEGEYIYTKLPIGVENFYILEPYKQHHSYTCKVQVKLNTEDDLQLSALLEDESGAVKAIIDTIILKKAPFEKYDRGAPAKLIEKYK